MLALSIQQPWAQLIALGRKRIETRGWRTAHRGPLAIHASKSFAEASRQLCFQEPFRRDLAAAGFIHSADLPRGAIIGTVELVACVPSDSILDELTDAERLYGDLGPGLWAWRLADARPLDLPLPMTGHLGLFKVELPDTLSKFASPVPRPGY
jgi:hypothetical protein